MKYNSKQFFKIDKADRRNPDACNCLFKPCGIPLNFNRI